MQVGQAYTLRSVYMTFTCFFNRIHLSPKHSVFVVIFWGIQICVQSPFPLPIKNKSNIWRIIHLKTTRTVTMHLKTCFNTSWIALFFVPLSMAVHKSLLNKSNKRFWQAAHIPNSHASVSQYKHSKDLLKILTVYLNTLTGFIIICVLCISVCLPSTTPVRNFRRPVLSTPILGSSTGPCVSATASGGTGFASLSGWDDSIILSFCTIFTYARITAV